MKFILRCIYTHITKFCMLIYSDLKKKKKKKKNTRTHSAFIAWVLVKWNRLINRRLLFYVIIKWNKKFKSEGCDLYINTSNGNHLNESHLLIDTQMWEQQRQQQGSKIIIFLLNTNFFLAYRTNCNTRKKRKEYKKSTERCLSHI